MKILDCTLRDGGYYTDWDFSREVVDVYFKSMNMLPMDYVEIGYRQNVSNGYVGQYGYSPLSTIERVREVCGKKMSVMINEKNTTREDAEHLLSPLIGLVDMVRIAVAPENVSRAMCVAKSVKDMGFEVGFNVMYMSKWKHVEGFYDRIKQLSDCLDVFYMVDSYGSVTKQDVNKAIAVLQSILKCKIGFHGHNNLQLALSNTIEAMSCGVDIVDCSVMGMGRGAGNLNTELLLTYLNREGLTVDFTRLSDVITAFQPLCEKYQWGTQLPYMIAGAYSLPQKEVMELVTNRIYSFESVVHGLCDKIDYKHNRQYKTLMKDDFCSAVIIGGGKSVEDHFDAIKSFINKQRRVVLVFASARYALMFKDIHVHKYYCLVGQEAKRLMRLLPEKFEGVCVLPPAPRRLGSEVPEFAQNDTYELHQISFTKHFHDSCTAVAIQTACEICKGELFVVGYDGYSLTDGTDKEVSLMSENGKLFNDYSSFSGRKLKSLTKTLYVELEKQSVYQYL